MIRILTDGVDPKSDILARPKEISEVAGAVRAILSAVSREGDAALFACAERYDGAKLTALEVPRAEIDAAYAAADPDFLRVLQQAGEKIRAFHQNQIRPGFQVSSGGVVMGQKVIPMERVGIYVPGGTAAYPSTVLMNAIPARLAGVKELLLASPPTGGRVSPAVLAAARVAGVDRIFAMGGAQAVAAFAYGTESVPRADKIVGPGNAYVAEAKRQVAGTVGIDMIAGPSEVMIIADGASDACAVAADLLAQAEHDANASSVLLTGSRKFALAVQAETERQLRALPREKIARASIEHNGRIVLVKSMERALTLANEFAPEHLELCVEDPFAWLGMVKNAGSVFLGRCCPEALGDYLAGPNHTLPTGGCARFASPLSVDDFVKKTQYTYFTAQALKDVAEDIALFARAEGLEAHARSAQIRFSKEGRV